MRVAYCRPESRDWPSAGEPPAGWSVYPLPDCSSLEECARETALDAVLMRLPPSAEDLLSALSRVRVASPGLPVIVLAEPAREEAAVAAVSAGAADYWLYGMSAVRLRVSVEQAVARRAQSVLQAARDEALERVEDAVVVTDAEERVVYWNRAAARLYGYAYPDVLGRPLPETLSPLWLDARTRRTAWKALDEKGLWLGEIVHARRDGAPLRVRMELSVMRDGRGRRAGLLLVARPPEGAARPAPEPAERDPRDARAFLEGLLNAVADPIFVKDREYRMLLVNDAYCALMGCLRSEVLGHVDGEHMLPEQAEGFHRADDRVFETGQEDVREELVTDSKGLAHVLVTKKALGRGADGEPILVGVIRDVTTLAKAVDDLKRSQEQLRHAQKLEAIGRLAGGVAHDFNNVLTAIVGCAELLLESLPPGHPCREEADDIRLAGEKAETLVGQLLAFSRREQSAPRLIDLREVFGGMRKMLSRLLPADIELEFVIPDRLGAVRADPGLAEQILLNLAVNAGDALPDGGRITVSLRDAPEGGGGLSGPCVLLEVRDDGIGMDESVRARVFDPFFTTKEDGTGLGLATVRDAATRSGGAVSVESAPGRGAAFRVFWPRAEGAAEPAAAARPVAASPKAPRRALILVVEDDEAVRRFAMRSLERAGYEVVTAADGAEALRLSDSHEGLFDAVVLDVVLPRVRGPEVAERLRARQPTARVLFVSGYRTEEASLPAGPDGRCLFLPKPFTAADLAEKIRELVATAR